MMTSLIVNSQVDAFELMRVGGGSRGWELDVNCTWYNESTLLRTAATTRTGIDWAAPPFTMTTEKPL